MIVPFPLQGLMTFRDFEENDSLWQCTYYTPTTIYTNTGWPPSKYRVIYYYVLNTVLLFTLRMFVFCFNVE